MISVQQLLEVLASFVFSFFSVFCLFLLSFCSYVSGLAYVVVFSYPVRRHLTCLTLEFAIYFHFLAIFFCDVCDDRIIISLG